MSRWWNRQSAARLSVLRRARLWSAFGLGVRGRTRRRGRCRQPRAGRVHHGNTHVRSRRITCSRIRSGTSYAGVGEVGVEVDDGLDGDLGPGVAAPVLDLVEQHQPLTFLQPPGRTEDRGQVVDGCVEVGVEHDLAGGRQPVGVAWRRLAPLRVEVERGLGAGQVAEGLRAAGVQRLARTRAPSAVAAPWVEGSVEVEGVGDVELGLQPHRAGEVHVVVVDRGVARVDVEVAVLRIRSRVDRCEVVAPDRLRDEPVQLRRHRPDRRPRRPGRRRTRRPRGSGRGWRGWWPPRPSGPATPAPGRPGPAPTAAGGGGAARGRGRRASSPPSSRSRGRHRARRGRTPPPAAHPHRRWVPRARTRDRERRRVMDRLRRVQVGPPRGQRRAGRLLPGPRLPCARERARAGREAVRSSTSPASGPCQCLDHVFDSIGDHRQSAMAVDGCVATLSRSVS